MFMEERNHINYDIFYDQKRDKYFGEKAKLVIDRVERQRDYVLKQLEKSKKSKGEKQ